MKKIVVLALLTSGFLLSQTSFANDSEVKLKRSCIKDNPLVEGENDPALLGIYAQACDRKNKDNKNAYLVQAAQRYQQLGKNFKALQLVNELQNQNVQSNTLTDVKFLAAANIANSAISQIRTKEMRYLTSDGTYPAAKELTDSINAAKPASVLVNAKAKDDDESKTPVRSVRTRSSSSAHRAATKSKPKATTAKPKATTPAASKPTSSNPFAGL
ncbi:hypothetical protein [Acinetobacter stercoris]|uniref:Uncharacterized protein n=1 Tax=Acinetobacter stercoris TaxID=2126983 RepID=A0A2U3MW99_9GAMM|nr:MULTISPECIES: hypothetical protein [Acinetobacter]SPL69702.1 hypothetical protein KPC_0880 [Acinetobacter stercoris]